MSGNGNGNWELSLILSLSRSEIIKSGSILFVWVGDWGGVGVMGVWVWLGFCIVGYGGVSNCEYAYVCVCGWRGGGIPGMFLDASIFVYGCVCIHLGLCPSVFVSWSISICLRDYVCVRMSIYEQRPLTP